MPPLRRTRCHVPARHERGLLDTSVLIDFEKIDDGRLPVAVAVSAMTMAELAAGPHATSDPHERGRRQDRLQRAEATFDPAALRRKRSSCLRAHLRGGDGTRSQGPRRKSRRLADRSHSTGGRASALHPQPRRLPGHRRARYHRGRLTVARVSHAYVVDLAPSPWWSGCIVTDGRGRLLVLGGCPC